MSTLLSGVFLFGGAGGGYAASLSNFERGIGRKPEKKITYP